MLRGYPPNTYDVYVRQSDSHVTIFINSSDIAYHSHVVRKHKPKRSRIRNKRRTKYHNTIPTAVRDHSRVVRCNKLHDRWVGRSIQ